MTQLTPQQEAENNIHIIQENAIAQKAQETSTAICDYLLQNNTITEALNASVYTVAALLVCANTTDESPVLNEDNAYKMFKLFVDNVHACVSAYIEKNASEDLSSEVPLDKSVVGVV